MRCFEWISPQRLPQEFDLRARGWRLAAAEDPEAIDCVRLIDVQAIEVPLADPVDRLSPARRSRSLALGIADSGERARWLTHGFGEALAWDTGLDELATRAARLLALSRVAPRRHGRLELDPLARDAAVDGRRLRLFPREFALLWRLSEDPGAAIPRAELLRDVLGLSIEPGTNALAVHICRLRRKLHVARLSHLLVAGPSAGSYALLFDTEATLGFGRRNALDGARFSGEDIMNEDMTLLEEAAE